MRSWLLLILITSAPLAQAQILSITEVESKNLLRPGLPTNLLITLAYHCNNNIQHNPEGYDLEVTLTDISEGLSITGELSQFFEMDSCIESEKALQTEFEVTAASNVPANSTLNATLDFKVYPRSSIIELTPTSNTVEVRLPYSTPPAEEVSLGAKEPAPDTAVEAPGPAVSLIALGSLALAAVRRKDSR